MLERAGVSYGEENNIRLQNSAKVSVSDSSSTGYSFVRPAFYFCIQVHVL